MGYVADRQFGDRFMPIVKAILGQFLLTDDCGEEDKKRNTDLIVLTMDKKRIGVRVRRHSYIEYSDEYTIRFSKFSGEETEYQKIIDGWGDYFFYAFANKDETGIDEWMIGDYEKFRKMIKKYKSYYGDKKYDTWLKNHEHIVNENYDSFLSIHKKEIPGFVAADSETWAYTFWKEMTVSKQDEKAVSLPF